MRLPSVKRIEEFLSVDIQTAYDIRMVMEDEDGNISYSYAMRKIDKIYNTHGVESVCHRNDFYRREPWFDYCNTGDPYTPTVVYVYNPKNYGPTTGFKLTTWGDLVEKWPGFFDDSVADEREYQKQLKGLEKESEGGELKTCSNR